MSLKEAAELTLVAMLIVFVILAALSAALTGLRYFKRGGDE